MTTQRHDYSIHPCFWEGADPSPGTLPRTPKTSATLPNNWTSQHDLLYDLDIQTGNPISLSHGVYRPRSAYGSFSLQQIDNDLNPLSPHLTPAQSVALRHPRWTAVYLRDRNGRYHLHSLGTSTPSPRARQPATGPISYEFSGAQTEDRISTIRSAAENTAQLADIISPYGWDLVLPSGSRPASSALQGPMLTNLSLTTRGALLHDTMNTLIPKIQPIFNAHIIEAANGSTTIASLAPRGTVSAPDTAHGLRWDANALTTGYAPDLQLTRTQLEVLYLATPATTYRAASTFTFELPQTYEILLMQRLSNFAIFTNGPLQVRTVSLSSAGSAQLSHTIRLNRDIELTHFTRRPVKLGSITIRRSGNTIAAADVYLQTFSNSNDSGTFAAEGEFYGEIGLYNITGTPPTGARLTITLQGSNTNPLKGYRIRTTTATLLLQHTDTILTPGTKERELQILKNVDFSPSTTVPFFDAFADPPLHTQLRLPFRQQAPAGASPTLATIVSPDALGTQLRLAIPPSTATYRWQLMAKRLVQPFNQTPYMDIQLLAFP